MCLTHQGPGCVANPSQVVRRDPCKQRAPVQVVVPLEDAGWRSVESAADLRSLGQTWPDASLR